MKITNRNLLTAALIAFFIQGCATLMQGGTQQVNVGSFPPGATVLVDGELRFTTPTVLELSRKESHRVEISLEGYHPETVELRSVSSNMIAGNIIAGGLIGFAVDHSTGASMRLVPEVVQVNLRPITPQSAEPPVATSPDLPTSANQEAPEVTTQAQP